MHSPVGGQGLNTGVQDAVNLGWKLAQVVNRTSPDSLLDTYHAERRPIAARVLRKTDGASRARRPADERLEALRDTVADLLSMDEPAQAGTAAMTSGLDVHYDLGEGHPLLGRHHARPGPRDRRRPVRVFELLHGAKPVPAQPRRTRRHDIAPWADRVQLIDASYQGEWGSRYSAWSTPPPACWFARTATSPGSETEPTWGSPTQPWFGSPGPETTTAPSRGRGLN